jgi:nickel-dependent lactate racemase
VIIGRGHKEGRLPDTEVEQVCRKALRRIDLGGKRVLALIPDGTRSAPMGLMFRLLCGLLAKRARKLDFLIALGTHMPMTEERILKRLEITAEERRGPYGLIGIFNHEWNNPEALKVLGTLGAGEMDRLSEGRYAREDVVGVDRQRPGAAAERETDAAVDA